MWTERAGVVCVMCAALAALLPHGAPARAEEAGAEPSIEEMLRAVEAKLRDRQAPKSDAGAAGAEATAGARAGLKAADESGLDSVLAEFGELFAGGDYEGARAVAERGAKSGRDAAAREALLAAARVAKLYEGRAERVRAAVKRLQGKTASFYTRSGPRKGEVTDVDPEGFSITAKSMIDGRAVGERTFKIAWRDLTERQEAALIPRWKPEGADWHAGVALKALQEDDIKAVEGALAAAGGHPLARWIRHRIATFREGAAEGEASRAWASIQRRLAGKSVSPALARKLAVELADFEKAHGGTAFAAVRAGEMAGLALKLRMASGHALTDGLVAHWPLDEKEGTVAHDLSGNGSDGTLHGGKWTEGRIAGALGFDGVDDYVQIPAAVTSGMTTFSFSFWVNTTESRTHKRYWRRPCLFGQSTAGKGTGDLVVNSGNGYIGLFHGLDAEDRQYLSTTTRIGDGTWHRVAVTADASNVKLYVDGRCEASLPTAGSALNVTAFRIGARGGNEAGGYHHSGAIDDVRIYDRVLAAEEIRLLGKAGAR